MSRKFSLMDMVNRAMERLGTLKATHEDRERLKVAVSEEISRWYQEETGQSMPLTIIPEIAEGSNPHYWSITDVVIYADKAFFPSSYEATHAETETVGKDGAVVKWWARSPGFRPTVVFDFDGVIHSYISGWQGSDAAIPDPPVSGIKEAIDHIRAAGYRVVVVSTRCRSVEGQYAIAHWLRENGIEVDNITSEKPPAVCYIDDRALTFDGHPETLLERIVNFRPWYQFKKE